MPTCPRCDSSLHHERRFDSDVYVCPSCHGVLAEQRRLIPLLQAAGDALALEVSADTPVEAAPDHGDGLRCPLCHGGTAHFGYMGTRLAMLDRCGACAVVWLDAEALLAAALLLVRTEQRRVDRAARSAAALEGTTRRFQAIRAARLVERMLM